MEPDGELNNGEESNLTKKIHLEWIPELCLHPRRALKTILEAETALWLTPMLVLTVLGILSVLISGPVRSRAALQSMVQPNPEMQQYLSPEQLQQMQSGLSVSQGPLFIYGFPLISTLASIWLGWLLMGGLLHLGLTLSGSRSSNRMTFNLAAWAALPLGLRLVVQTLGLLISGKPIASPGLSGFIDATTGGGAAFFGALLSQVDVYLLWQLFLIGMGVTMMGGDYRKKSLAAAAIVAGLVIILFAAPTFLSNLMLSMASSGGGVF
jgi:hypothetical protein